MPAPLRIPTRADLLGTSGTNFPGSSLSEGGFECGVGGADTAAAAADRRRAQPGCSSSGMTAASAWANPPAARPITGVTPGNAQILVTFDAPADNGTRDHGFTADCDFERHGRVSERSPTRAD